MIDLQAPSSDGANGRTFDVLVAGAALPPNPGELVESHAMETLLEQAKSKYDLVVVDTPPRRPTRLCRPRRPELRRGRGRAG